MGSHYCLRVFAMRCMMMLDAAPSGPLSLPSLLLSPSPFPSPSRSLIRRGWSSPFHAVHLFQHPASLTRELVCRYVPGVSQMTDGLSVSKVVTMLKHRLACRCVPGSSSCLPPLRHDSESRVHTPAPPPPVREPLRPESPRRPHPRRPAVPSLAPLSPARSQLDGRSLAVHSPAPHPAPGSATPLSPSAQDAGHVARCSARADRSGPCSGP